MSDDRTPRSLLRSGVRPTVLLAALCSAAFLVASGTGLAAPGDEDTTPGVDDYEEEGTWLERLRLFQATRQAPPGVDPDEAMRAAIAAARAMPLARNGLGIASLQTVPGDRWTSVGPSAVIGLYGRLSTGRVRAIAVDPTDPTGNTIYVGTALGGVWKTWDGGQIWYPKSDFECSLATETIAIDPQDHLVVYAGTGESAGRGCGILKSLDGGARWTTVGDDPDQIRNSTVHKLALVPGTLAHPAWQRIVLAATDLGIARSPDGGDSWTFPPAGGASATDLVIDPHNPSIAYAGVPGRGVYRSSDAGASWSLLSDANGALPVARFARINLAVARNNATGVPTVFASFEDTAIGQNLKGIWKTSDGGAHWTRVTGHPRQFADGAWATPDLFESEPNDSSGLADPTSINQVIEGTITGSNDVDTFTVTISGNDYCAEVVARRAGSALDPVLTVSDATGKVVRVGDGSLGSTASPLFDERVGSGGWEKLIPGQYYIKVESKNHDSQGRYQLSIIGHDLWCQCGYDQMVAVDPQFPNILYSGTIKLARTTDGGANWTQINDHGANDNWVHQDIHALAFDPANPSMLYLGSDGGVYRTVDRGDTWSSLSPGLAVSQIYAGMSQSPTDPDFVVIGLQDGGSARRQSGAWYEVMSGDGGYTAIASPQVWYASAQGLSIGRTQDGGAHFYRADSGLKTDGLGIDAPFVMAPYDSNVMIAGGGEWNESTKSQHWHPYRTDNGGNGWYENGPDMQAGILTLAFAPSDPEVYYVGTWSGQLWRTGDKGAHWSSISLFPGQAHPLTRIAVDRTNSRRLFVTAGDFGATHVFGSTDGGASFTPRDNGLPNCPFHAIAIDPNYPNTLFAGGDVGVFRSTDGGLSWQRFGTGLPNVPVNDLVISPNAGPTGSLIVATFGRGLWELRPGNDPCEGADVIGDGSFSGSTRGATADGWSTCGNADGSPDVWYRYTAPCDGDLWLDTCGADFNAVVALYEPFCPATELSEQLCAADCTAGSCGAPAACVKAKVAAGDEHFVRVTGRDGAVGDFGLHTLCRVPNDDCGSAVALVAGGSAEAGTRGATPDGAPPCDGVDDEGPGIWYTVVGTGTTLTASTCVYPTDFDTELSVYCVGCGAPRCVAANDDAYGCSNTSEVSWCSERGQIYQILVHGYRGNSGAFRLEIREGAPCSDPPDCSAANDHCDEALPVVTGETWGSTWGADTDTLATCAPSNGDVWMRWEPLCNGVATIDTCATGGTLLDSVLSVHDGCGGPILACNDDGVGTCGSRSLLDIGHAADRPLALRLASYGPAGPPGTFPLTITSATTNPVAPASGFYVAAGAGSWAGNLLRLDLFDGSAVAVGPLGMSNISGLAWAPDLGLLYGVADAIDDARLVLVDPATGAASPLGHVGTGSVRGLAYDPNRGTLYATQTSGDQLLALDPKTGAGRLVGPLGFTRVEGLAYDPGTDTLYGSDADSDHLIVIDTSTGAGHAIGPFGYAFDEIDGMAFDTATQTLYGVQNDQAASRARIVVIITTTGEAYEAAPAFDNVAPLGLDLVGGLPRAHAFAPYDASIPASGGCPPYGFTDVAGLPTGLTADPLGRITGAPTEVGTFNVSYDVDDRSLTTPWSSGSKVLRVSPENDECAAASPVGEGRPHHFTTINATTDGPDEPDLCSAFGDTQVDHDVWFCYPASCTGTLLVSTCASDYDTRLAVYSDCGCDFRTTHAIACNDDACGSQSQVSLPVTAGQSYGIRIGGYRGARGSGALELTCAGAAGAACCTGDGCSFRTAVACDGAGGVFKGAGTSCDTDSDGDSLADVCDGCPSDPSRVTPGPCGCNVTEYDMDGDGSPDCIDPEMDGDGVPNAEDSGPTDPYACRDLDADGCDDCSSGIAAPGSDGPDADGDGYCATGDCNDADGDLWRRPGEAANVRVRSNRVTMTWDAPSDPGCAPSRLVYDTLRSGVPSQFREETECIESDDGRDRAATDGTIPLAGRGFYYLVRAQNGCGAGSLGQRSDGAERRGRDCP